MRRVLRLYRDAYSGLPAEAWLLSAVAFVNRSGAMVLPFLALYLTRELGMAETDAGLLLGAYGLGALLGNELGGRLCDRIGNRAVQLGSLLGSAVGFVLLGQLREPVALAAALLVVGAVTEAFRPANGAAVAATTTGTVQRRALALNRLAINLGWTVGPTLGGFLAEADYALLFWFDGATCAAAGALLWWRGRPDTPAAVHEHVQSRAPWRDRPFLLVMLATLLVALVFMQIFAAMPIYLRDEYGLRESRIGLLFALNPILIVLLEMALVHVFSNRDALRVAAVGSLVTGAGFALLPLGDTFAFGLLVVGVWTFGEMLGAPFLAAYVATRAAPRNRGAYFGVFGLVHAVSFTLAPVLGTQAYEGLGPTVLWTACGVMGVLSALGMLWTARR